MTNRLPNDELLSAYLDGEATPAERAAVERALAASSECRQMLEDLCALRDELQSLPQLELDAGFANRVLQRAEQAMLSGPALREATTSRPPAAANGEPDAAAAPAPGPRAPDRPAGGRRVPAVDWRQAAAALLVLAAAIAVMVGPPAAKDPGGTTLAWKSNEGARAVQLTERSADRAGPARADTVRDRRAPTGQAALAKSPAPEANETPDAAAQGLATVADRPANRGNQNPPQHSAKRDTRTAAAEEQRDRLSDGLVVVHVDVSEAAWRRGEVRKLLEARDIAWLEEARPDAATTRLKAVPAGDPGSSDAKELPLAERSEAVVVQASREQLDQLLDSLRRAAPADAFYAVTVQPQAPAQGPPPPAGRAGFEPGAGAEGSIRSEAEELHEKAAAAARQQAAARGARDKADAEQPAGRARRVQTELFLRKAEPGAQLADDAAKEEALAGRAGDLAAKLEDAARLANGDPAADRRAEAPPSKALIIFRLHRAAKPAAAGAAPPGK